MLSVQNITAIVVILVFLVELYFCTAGSNHRRKRLLSGWNPVKGRIKTVEEKRDEIYHKKYIELTIEVGDGRLVYSKQNPMFCIYEEGEEVDLMENKGVHRFCGRPLLLPSAAEGRVTRNQTTEARFFHEKGNDL